MGEWQLYRFQNIITYLWNFKKVTCPRVHPILGIISYTQASTRQDQSNIPNLKCYIKFKMPSFCLFKDRNCEIKSSERKWGNRRWWIVNAVKRRYWAKDNKTAINSKETQVPAWNALPEDTRAVSDSVLFRKRLKTHFLVLLLTVVDYCCLLLMTLVMHLCCPCNKRTINLSMMMMMMMMI